MKNLVGFVFKAFAFFISVLPLSVRLSLGDLLGLLWFDVFRIRRQVALQNLRIAFPEWTEEQRVTTARWSLRNMGRGIIDFASLPFFNDRMLSEQFEFQGLENVKNALLKKRGVLLLGLHFGPGDFGIAATSRKGLPLNLISKEFKTKWLNDLWFGMRGRQGTKFISPEKSSFDILRALKRNECVVFVLDQFMGPPIGVRTNFFGKETGTAAGLALMAGRTQAPVLACYPYRRGDGKIIIVFENEVSFQAIGPNNQNIARMTQVYTDKLEEIVRKHPEQWMWIHRRWKEFRD